MEKELNYATIVSMLSDLAFCRADDAVKIAIDPTLNCDELDLRLVSEVKRNTNGTIEIKLLDREKLISLLIDLVRPSSSSSAENLYSAIDKAATKLGDVMENAI